MKKYLLIILLTLVACKKERARENFDYVTFTPMHSAIVKISDLSKYQIEFSTQIEGKTENYDFYKENNNEIFKNLISSEAIFYINFEEENNRISITYSMRKQESNAQGHNIIYVPIKGELKERSSDSIKTLNFKFTFLDGKKKNFFLFTAQKIKEKQNQKVD